MEQSRGRSALSGAQTLEHETGVKPQNGTVVALRPQQQAQIEAASPKRPLPRGRNAERRPREFLTPDEVDRLIATAKQRGRWGQRDAAAILLAFSHGLRVSEIVSLTWAQINFRDG